MFEENLVGAGARMWLAVQRDISKGLLAVFATAVGLLCISVAAHCQDTIYLKNGDTLTGTITAIDEETVTVETEYGRLIIDRDKIEHIVLEERPKPEPIPEEEPAAERVEKPIQKVVIPTIGDIGAVRRATVFRAIGSSLQGAASLYGALEYRSSFNMVRAEFEGTFEDIWRAAGDANANRNTAMWFQVGSLSFDIFLWLFEKKSEREAYERFERRQPLVLRYGYALGKATGYVAAMVALVYDYAAVEKHHLGYARHDFITAANHWRKASHWSWASTAGYAVAAICEMRVFANTSSRGLSEAKQAQQRSGGVFVCPLVGGLFLGVTRAF